MSARPLPAWFDDAKIGMFVHWGLYSVPAWAPRTPDIQRLLHDEGPRAMLRDIPYAEWYRNTMAIEGSPTQRHHRETYGADFAYDDFRPMFDDATGGADVDAIAALAEDAGAGYVVLTTKHADGFSLWPTEVPHPRKGEYRARRDLVGDLTAATRARGLRMGLYYCGGYDWAYTDRVMRHGADLLLAIPTTPEYERFAAAQVRELVERYRPSVLWGDVAWPVGDLLGGLIADYYAAVPDGVVNDRWAVIPGLHGGVRRALLSGAGRIAEALWSRLPDGRRRLAFPPSAIHDFTTPEYEIPDAVRAEKWEATRGVGNTFGANHHEDPASIISGDELVRLVCDVVARNGNLLIGVGPDAAGVIPDAQTAPMRALGAWMRTNGAAIRGSRPWVLDATTTATGAAVRFTVVDGAVHALVDASDARVLRFAGLRAEPGATAVLLGTGAALDVVTGDGECEIHLPVRTPEEPVHAIRLDGVVPTG